MLIEATSERTQSAAAAAFWWRLLDNLFRRLPLFILPVLAFAAVGVLQAGKSPELYRSSGSLSASVNPLVPAQPIAGTSAQFLETPAAATSRIINERLRTDSFLTKVAEEAGLKDEVDTGLLSLEVIRQKIWASENGESILKVTAEWDDPQTSQQLAVATIDQYQVFLNETLASDAREAEAFYTEQLDSLTAERDAAQQELETYAAQLPPVADEATRPLSEKIELDRLTNALSTAEKAITTAQDEIDKAQLAQVQQASEAGRSLTVIDNPKVPSAPESTLLHRLITVAFFTLLGALIAAGALVITTLTQQTVLSAVDLIGLDGVNLVATVPVLAAPPGRSTETTRGRRARRPT